jgi:hypothetical protein
MQKIITKIITSFKTIGITRTIIKLSKHLFNKLFRDKKIEEKIFSFQNIEDRFTEIYRKNLWGNFESVSGNGSTLEGTKNLRSKLPELFEKFSIKIIFDAPCGDFNWMRHFLEKSKVNYIGGDIVRPLIDEHNTNFQNASTNFLHVDITKDTLPEADLMICRDCLFHLSYNDTKLFLQNFIESKMFCIESKTLYLMKLPEKCAFGRESRLFLLLESFNRGQWPPKPKYQTAIYNCKILAEVTL